MDALKELLTPERRKAIYGLVSAALFCLLAFGVVTTDQISEWTQAIVGIVAALTSLMAFLNTHPDTDTTEQLFVSEQPSGEPTEASEGE